MEITKFKVLCLHGYKQNSVAFKNKLGSFRKILKSIAEFHFVNAPNLIQANDGDEETFEGELRSWWFNSQDQTFSSAIKSFIDDGFQESIESLDNYVRENGPFDALLGFSQGAALVAMLCSMIQKGELKWNIKFVVIAAGFKSLCEKHAYFYDENLTIPSLHIIGDDDKVIPCAKSIELMDIFKNPDVVRHQGGHFIPAAKDFRVSYIDFFKKIL